MGVGLYETLMELDRINPREVEYRATRRLADVTQNLASAADWMDTTGNSLPPAPRARLLRFLRDAHGALSTCGFAGFEIVEGLAPNLEEGSI
jgi:hypothetical protein